MVNRINRFRGDYFYLSNFYNAPVEYKGVHFKNNEAAFQSAKLIGTSAESNRKKFSNMEPSMAKREGRRVVLRSDWEKVKDKVMYDIVKNKFINNPALKNKLLETDDAILTEGNTWNDTYWGYDTKQKRGLNKLGKILMQVRRELKEVD